MLVVSGGYTLINLKQRPGIRFLFSAVFLLQKQDLQARRVIDVVKKHNPETKIVLAGMEIPDIFPGRYASEFRVLFRELALKNNLTFIPFLLEGVVGVQALNLPDRFHPNTEGHKVMARHVWTFLKEIL